MTRPRGKKEWLRLFRRQLVGKQCVETSQTRLLVISIVFSVLFIALLVRLISMTVLMDEGDARAAIASAEGDDLSRREIVDRNGELIAINLTTASLYVDPKNILDPKESAKNLHAILPELSYEDLLKKFTSKKRFIWLKRNITPKEQYAINSLGIPGLNFEEEQKRIYPKGNLFSHALGYVGFDNTGLAGLEKHMDSALKGHGKAEPLQVSLDVRVQGIMREELARYKEEFKAIGAMGLMMDVNNGEIIALVSLPDFDPQNPGKASDDSKFNRATLGVFEMGSTFKVFNTAMALDTGSISIRGGYDVSQPIRIGRFTIRDYHPFHGWMSVPEILMESSNIGSAKMAMDAGAEVQQYFMKELGMLSQAKIELPERGTPMYPRQWGEASTMTISYGHGISVTPVHVVSGMSAMVNGGFLYPATLLKRPAGKAPEAVSVISDKTSRMMRQLLRLVVEKGTGSKADAEGYMVGGKTGTAEKVGEAGRYKRKALVSSFVGIFPMNKPRYVVLVMMDEPQGNRSTGYYSTGGQVAAPVVHNVIARSAPILGVMPVDKNSAGIRRSFWVDVNGEEDEPETY